MMSPTQSSEHQVDYWKKQEYKFLQMLMSSEMSYYEVQVLYKTIYIPTMRYIMPFTNVKNGVIKKLTLKSTNSFLNKVGYASSTSRAVVYGPVMMGGLGWYELEVEVGISHLERFIHGLNDNNQLGKLTQAAITTWFWAIGYSPFDSQVSRADHDETVWLKNVYEFIQEHNIKVNCPIKSEPLQREGDDYIMEKPYKLALSDAEIKYVNYC
jgi:hypothetical protein